MSDQAADKSQEPTGHRRQKARQEGHVAKSQDLSSAALLLLGLLLLVILGGGLVDFLGRFCKRQLGGGAWLEADVRFAVSEWNWTLSALARCLFPIFGLLFLGAIATGVLQTGFLFLPRKLVPDLTRLDPLQGLNRIFSLGNLVKLAFGILKILVVSAVAVLSLYAERDTILNLPDMAVPVIALYLAQILLWTSIKIGLALLVLASLDYAFWKWKFEQDIKMTPQELREEMRNLDSGRQLTSRRRRMQRQPGSSRRCDAVPKADL